MSTGSEVVHSIEEGVPTGYVKLISGDNYEFLVEVQYACASSVLRTMLEGLYDGYPFSK
jgi:Skp1 family, tetramerisation domain